MLLISTLRCFYFLNYTHTGLRLRLFKRKIFSEIFLLIFCVWLCRRSEIILWGKRFSTYDWKCFPLEKTVSHIWDTWPSMLLESRLTSFTALINRANVVNHVSYRPVCIVLNIKQYTYLGVLPPKIPACTSRYRMYWPVPIDTKNIENICCGHSRTISKYTSIRTVLKKTIR